MKTSEIAKLACVHKNTVHLYESWGYISPVPRLANRYRNYSLVHVVQIILARIVFRHEFIQNNLRKMATAIVLKSGQQLFYEALEKAKVYASFLQSELDFTLKAVQTVNQLLSESESSQIITYTHKQASSELNLTEETLRNWERNGLYSVERNAQNHRIYNQNDIKKLLIIRTLRTAHFSISSIRHFLVDVHHVHSLHDIKEALNMPAFKDDFIHVTDALVENLNKAITNIKSAIALLESYIKGELSLASLSTMR